MGRRQYAGGAQAIALTGPVAPTDILLPVGVTIGWPDGSVGPFAAAINVGAANEEKVLLSGISGGNMQVLTRGYDGTAAVNHDGGELVRLVGTSVDFDEANAHVNSSVDVHGLTGGDTIMGAKRVQVVQGKTMDGLLNTFTNLPLVASPETVAALSTQATEITALTTSLSQEISDRGAADALLAPQATTYTKTQTDSVVASEAAARVAGDALAAPQATTYTKTQVDSAIVADRSASVTLTNHTIDGAGNTLTNIPATSLAALVLPWTKASKGTATVNMVHGGNSATSGTIAHGLGTTPTQILLTHNKTGGTEPALITQAVGITSSVFQVHIETNGNVAIGGSDIDCHVAWLAVA